MFISSQAGTAVRWPKDESNIAESKRLATLKENRNRAKMYRPRKTCGGETDSCSGQFREGGQRQSALSPNGIRDTARPAQTGRCRGTACRTRTKPAAARSSQTLAI